MSKADELLREYFDALDASRDPTIVGSTCRLIRAESAIMDYLNEKPQIKDAGAGDVPDIAPPGATSASPPRAAAEPEKPVAWMYEDAGTKIVSNERWAQKFPYTETPLYASPSAQPAKVEEPPTDPAEKKIWDVFQRVGGLAIPHVWSAFRKGWKEAEYAAQSIAREPTGAILEAMRQAIADAGGWGGWVNDKTLAAMWRAAIKSAGKEP